MDRSTEKQALRAAMRQRKRAMTPMQMQTASRQLEALLYQHPLYRQAESVYGYLPCNQEVRLLPMLRRAMEEGKRVAVPKIFGSEMKFIWLEDLEQVRPGFRGIPEPIRDGPEADDPHALVLLPGLAFDARGFRVGYGGGFYDRFLVREPNHPTLGLCYGFQLVDHIQEEAFDLPAQAVLWADAKEETK